MKKLIFLASNRNHLARNQLLLNELKNNFKVHILTYEEQEMSMPEISLDIGTKFLNAIQKIKPNVFLARGDRFEILSPVMLSAYSEIPIVHLESFDESGVIDNKVRGAISCLADYHFTTNDESYRRGLSMGFKNVYQCGSLDCEYALSVPPSELRPKQYILVLWHEIPNEDSNELYGAIQAFQDYEIVGVKGNKDYGIESSYKEEYSPEDFVNLLRGASCVVGNSSCFIKECSVLGVPAVLVGSRQQNRLTPHNVLNVACKQKNIELGLRFQLGHGVYEKSEVYSKPLTSKLIADKIGELL